MSWLNLIVENILCEISSKDAYERFYSNSISPEIFRGVTGGKDVLTKVDTFFLNAIRDGSIDAVETMDNIGKLRDEDPDIRKKIENKIAHNEYHFPQEIPYDIESIKIIGMSIKKWDESNFIKLGSNDEWDATTVLTRSASRHYFGHTEWCTASSDSSMFFNYSLNANSVLIQFTKKSNKYETFQIQCYVTGGDRFGDSKDVHDSNVAPGTLRKLVGNELFDDVTRKDVLQKCFELLKDRTQKDNKVEIMMSESRSKVCRLFRQKYDGIRKEMQKEVDEFNQRQEEYNKKMLAQIEHDGLLMDIDFLNVLFKNRDLFHIKNRNETEILPKLNETHNLVVYANSLTSHNSKRNWQYPDADYFLSIYQIAGQRKRIKKERKTVDNDESMFYEVPSIEVYVDSARYSSPLKSIVVKVENETITEIVKGTEDLLKIRGVNEYFLKKGKLLNYIYSAKNRKYYLVPSFWDSENIESYCPATKDGYSKYEVLHSNSSSALRDDSDEFLFFDTISGDLVRKSKPVKEIGQWIKKIVIFDENNSLWALLYNDTYSTGAYFELPDIEFDDISMGFIKDKHVIFFSNNAEHKKYASFLESSKNLIFGKNVNTKWGANGFKGMLRPAIYGVIEDGENSHHDIYCALGPTQYFVDLGEEGLVPCDKNGSTERDKRADKYLKQWQDNGGYSPEVKSEMDKMWNDRQGNRDVPDSDYERDRLGADYYASKDAFKEHLKDILGNNYNEEDWKDASGSNAKNIKDKYDDLSGPMDDKWRGYFRTMSDIDSHNIQNKDNDWKHLNKHIKIDKNGRDIPDWSEDDEMAVAKRNQDRWKEAGLNESANKMFRLLNILNDN